MHPSLVSFLAQNPSSTSKNETFYMWMIRVENLPHFLSQKNGRNNAEFGNCVPHQCFIKSLIVTVKNLPHRLDFSILAFYVGKKKSV